MAAITMEVRVEELPLAERFTIARRTWDTTTNVFVILRHDGATGIGEAGPAEEWGESVESVTAQLEGLDLGALSGPFDLETVATLLPPGSARCAFDMAMHDLAATLAGLPLNSFLGLDGRNLPPTSLTLPIAGVDKMVERAQKLSDHPVLKMKVGFDGDVEAVAAIREVFDGKLRVDANEGWTREDAIQRLTQMERFDIELCEQPIPGKNFSDLGAVRKSSPIPVFADEDVSDARDVAQLAGVVDGVNLKLRKAGGVREVVKAAAVARAEGLQVMLGCDLDTGVAATAGAHIASLMDFVDLDGPLLLERDPYPGVTYSKGEMTLPQGPGLGVAGKP